MANCVFRNGVRSHYMQKTCLWCGNRLSDKPCSVTDEIRSRIKQFAAEHGRTWKAALRKLWNSGQDTGDLRNARNTIGPRGLDRITDKLFARITNAIDRRHDD